MVAPSCSTSDLPAVMRILALRGRPAASYPTVTSVPRSTLLASKAPASNERGREYFDIAAEWSEDYGFGFGAMFKRK